VDVGAGAANPGDNARNADAIGYRDLEAHPGCSPAGVDARGAGQEDASNANNSKPYAAASIPGYRCAARAYPLRPEGEDTTKPVVLLVHGNSSTPSDYERHPRTSGKPMLAERLVEQGYRVYAVDFRYDLVDDPTGPDGNTGNPAKNFDHGWAVPIAQHFFERVFALHEGRSFSVVSFSLGPTVVRDALRRLHREGKEPFARLRHLVFAAGANHGVSTNRKLCGSDPKAPANPTMRGRVTCELGDRTAFVPTEFLLPLNGPAGEYETPCADGSTAWGQAGVCGGNRVAYTTVTMKDESQGTYQDEFVSEASAALRGADNRLVSLTDTDETGYFYNGLFKSHYGAVRSEAGLRVILEALGR
jgi:hypothetical protein